MSTPGPVRTGGHRGCNPTRVSADRAWLAVCPLSLFERNPSDASAGLEARAGTSPRATRRGPSGTIRPEPRGPCGAIRVPINGRTERSERHPVAGSAGLTVSFESSGTIRPEPRRPCGAIRTTPGGRLCRTHGFVRIERHDSTGASRTMRRDSNDTVSPAEPATGCRSDRSVRPWS